MTECKLTPPVKWHGGTFHLAEWIINKMQKHVHYVEPFFGGGQVLLRKNPEGVSEVANDINADLMTFWSVLKDKKLFPDFQRIVEATPFAEPEFEAAEDALASPDPVQRAVGFFVRCRQSLAGRMDTFTGVTKTRTRRGMNNEVSAWLSAIEGLKAVHERLKRVLLLNRPALDVIAKQDGPHTLFYCDPPYLHQTRAATRVYAHEMTMADHVDLLQALRNCKGKVMLSGYPSTLYDQTLTGWTRDTYSIANHAAGGDTKARETEVLWCNF
jgi:DNA adenine methylase